MTQNLSTIHVVFDGPPTHEGGRFVEVEDDKGHSLAIGEWLHRPDGNWALRIPNVMLPPQPAPPPADDPTPT